MYIIYVWKDFIELEKMSVVKKKIYYLKKLVTRNLIF